MKILLQKVTVTDPASAHHGKVRDVLIEDHTITQINKSIAAAKGVKTVDCTGLSVSPGWIDMQAHFQDPGNEVMEDIRSGSLAALNAGFAGVVLIPSTQPPLYRKAEIEYVINTAAGSITDVYPMGCISVNREGKELAELYDMKVAGAVAYTDGKRAVQDSGLMLRALMYTQSFGGLVMSFPEDTFLAAKGVANESAATTALGLKGIPALAETLMIERDLHLAEYTGARIHFATISSAASVKMIKAARKKGINVTCGVAVANLVLDDSALESYDTHYKVKPPLRGADDVKALRAGLADGTIDVIVSDHTPLDTEHKRCEFEFAAHGMLGLDTLWPLLNTHVVPHTGIDAVIHAITQGPRRVLGRDVVSLKEGGPASLTLFDTKKQWTLEAKHIHSKSANTPFIGSKFVGRPKGVINNGAYHAISYA